MIHTICNMIVASGITWGKTKVQRGRRKAVAAASEAKLHAVTGRHSRH